MSSRRLQALTLSLFVTLTACADQVARVTASVPPAASRPQGTGFTQDGMASWYGQTHHGRTTANGEAFDMNSLSAAHRTLAFGTMVNVTNKANGRSVTVRINDRGPYKDGRVIDLSARAARELGMTEDGVTAVRIEQVTAGQARN